MILAYHVELQGGVNIVPEKMLRRALFALGLTGICYVGFHHSHIVRTLIPLFNMCKIKIMKTYYC